LVDIVAGGFDAGVRLHEKLAKDMVAVKLGGEVRMRVVASPAYLARHGRPSTPGDLHRHRCLNYRWPTSGSLYRWEFECDGEKQEIAVEGPVIVDEPEVLVRAAMDGAGIAYLFEQQVAAGLADGRLLPLLDAWTPPFPGSLSVLSGKPPNAAPAACFYRLRPSTGRTGRITRFF
jgi:transcriptional regulator, LysR family